jgi:hypothetical protein
MVMFPVAVGAEREEIRFRVNDRDQSIALKVRDRFFMSYFNVFVITTLTTTPPT